MKIVLCAVNSAYIHKNLAILKLQKYLPMPVTLREYTVNQPLMTVYRSLLREKADVYCFSSYIWNITYELSLAEMLKKALDCTVIFGGSEAGGEPESFIKENIYVDYVIKGDGEKPLSMLLSALEAGDVPQIQGVYSKSGGCGKGEAPLDLPMPYSIEDIASCRDKIIYYEASRGCYNKCAYCMSSEEKCVNYDIEKVKKELSFLCSQNIPLIKFVDRSFNAFKSRAYELLKFLIEETGETSFHLEVSPDLFDEEILALIKTAPKGKLTFEAGLQSLNPETLAAVYRSCNLDRAMENLRKIISFGNISVHTDIIAGLPKEDFESFKKTFDGVYALHSDMFSVGFLKVLKGTKIREEAERYGIVYSSFPPYEVIKTHDLTPHELYEIHLAEEGVERLYNSGAFKYTSAYLESIYESPFSLYKDVGGLIYDGMSRRAFISALLKMFPEAFNALAMDFMLSDEKSAPAEFTTEYDDTFHKRCLEFTRDEIAGYFPELSDMPYREAFKKLKFYQFRCGSFVAGRSIKRVYKIFT